MLGLLIALAVFVVGGGTWFYLNFIQTYHYLVVHEGVLYRDGVRSGREFGIALANSHARSVVSFCEDREYQTYKPLQDEMNLLAHTKVRYYAVPIPLGGYPTTADVRRFLELTKENSRGDRLPLLVHCAQGIRRTGMMVAAYQMSELGFSKQQAKDAIQAFGHSERTINDIKKFIDVYDPIKREVTQTLPRGKESGGGEQED